MKVKGKIKDIKDEVVSARDKARREAKQHYPCVRSRGVEFYAIHPQDGKISDCEQYPLTLKNINSFIEEYGRQGATEFWLSGGYDGADSVHDMNDMCYAPWVSSWDVELEIETEG